MGRNKQRVAAIVQARMGSTRLPGKVMKEAGGYPLLWHALNRLTYSTKLEDIIVATTLLFEDHIIADRAKEWGFDCYRGSPKDLLDRYYQAAKHFNVDYIVRITADCPLIDPKVVDMVIGRFLELRDYDLVGTQDSFPDGLDTSVFSFAALERAWKEARLPSEREHVGPYIVKHPDIFKIASIPCYRQLGHMRWTVDGELDLIFVREVMKRLYREGDIFYMDDILGLLEREPHLVEINKGIVRNEGYCKSLKEDEKSLEQRKRDLRTSS